MHRIQWFYALVVKKNHQNKYSNDISVPVADEENMEIMPKAMSYYRGHQGHFIGVSIHSQTANYFRHRYIFEPLSLRLQFKTKER